MIGFEISLNGKRLKVTGADDGVLTVIITAVKPSRDLFKFHLSGRDEQTGEDLEWLVPAPHIGDEITVRIVDTDKVDPADNIRPSVEWLPNETFEEYEARFNAARNAFGD